MRSHRVDNPFTLVRRVMLSLLFIFLTVGCLAQWWWGIEVLGDHGSVRVSEYFLYDLPTPVREGGYVGDDRPEPVLLAAVPDCGYEFVEWRYAGGSGVVHDPFVTVEPTFLRYRRAAVTFAPTTSARNDCFATPQELTQIGLTGSVAFDNRRAGLEDGEPVHASTAIEDAPDGGAPAEHYEGSGASLWWTFDAPAAGVLRLDVQSGFQSVIAVYEGSTLDGLDPILACGLASGCMGVEVPVVEGDLLLIAIDGFGGGCIGCPETLVAIGPTGSGILQWALLPPVEPDESGLH